MHKKKSKINLKQVEGSNILFEINKIEKKTNKGKSMKSEVDS